MTEKSSKIQIDVRVTQNLDEGLFNYLSTGKGIERLRELFVQNQLLKSENEKLVEEINKHKNTLIGIRLSSRQSQANTDVMMGIFNTWLFHQSQMTPISLQDKKHPIISFYETERRKMLDNIAQRKVYNEKVNDEQTEEISTKKVEIEDDPF